MFLGCEPWAYLFMLLIIIDVQEGRKSTACIIRGGEQGIPHCIRTTNRCRTSDTDPMLQTAFLSLVTSHRHSRLRFLRDSFHPAHPGA